MRCRPTGADRARAQEALRAESAPGAGAARLACAVPAATATRKRPEQEGPQGDPVGLGQLMSCARRWARRGGTPRGVGCPVIVIVRRSARGGGRTSGSRLGVVPADVDLATLGLTAAAAPAPRAVSACSLRPRGGWSPSVPCRRGDRRPRLALPWRRTGFRSSRCHPPAGRGHRLAASALFLSPAGLADGLALKELRYAHCSAIRPWPDGHSVPPRPLLQGLRLGWTGAC